MDIGFDPSEWSAMRSQAAMPELSAHPEWHVLRTRLFAAVEARNALSDLHKGPRALAAGNFSRRTALSLERMESDCVPVNQTNSANCKPDSHMLADVVGIAITGGRG